MNDWIRALKTIQAEDPDGKPDKPTEADYEAHKVWAIDRFGQSVWNEYCSGNWDTPDNPV